MAEIDYYQILELDSNVTRVQIRRAFRTLAIRFHPDQNPTDTNAEERFKLITQAYKVLMDPKKRAQYDRTRRAAQAQRARKAGYARRRTAQRQPSEPVSHQRVRTAETSSKTPTDQQPRGTAWWKEEKPAPEPAPPPPPPPPEPEPVDGGDLEVDMAVSSEIAEMGGRQQLAVSLLQPCSACESTGAKPGTIVRRCPECDPRQPSPNCRLCSGRGQLLEAFCPICHGRGKTRATKTIVVTVPARSKSGRCLRVEGEGMPGREGGRPGDLIVRLKVKAAADYEQRDEAVYSEIHVTPAMAAQGSTVRVKTVDAWADLHIPPGTRSGTIFRLDGKGPIIQGNERGDHYVTVKIVIP